MGKEKKALRNFMFITYNELKLKNYEKTLLTTFYCTVYNITVIW